MKFTRGKRETMDDTMEMTHGNGGVDDTSIKSVTPNANKPCI
jgi:hypothetical protein